MTQNMLERPDLIESRSPRGLEVFQLTRESVPSSHVYMEAQIFTMDSRRLVVHRSAYAHGGQQHDPEHRYLLCDLEDHGRLIPLTDEVGVTGPSISPDDRYFYYFVNQTLMPGQSGTSRLILKRRQLDGTHPETLVVVDGPLPGTRWRPSRIYPLSTISSDGQRLAIAGFLGDGQTTGGPWGLMVFDVPSASVRLILAGTSWCNLHPQYSRSLDPQRSHDLLIQENHGNVVKPSGEFAKLVTGLGADIHVIRDDGQHFRNMPWGRDGTEFCQGHQCWRGRSDWAITSTVTYGTAADREAIIDPKTAPRTYECRLIEGLDVEHTDHIGLQSEGGRRNDLSRDFAKPDFCHFATDIDGQWFVSDASPKTQPGGALYYGRLGQPGVDALQNLTYLLNPRTSWTKDTHIHPFVSPDGKMAFFNSDESGVLQAYMVRGLPA